MAASGLLMHIFLKASCFVLSAVIVSACAVPDPPLDEPDIPPLDAFSSYSVPYGRLHIVYLTLQKELRHTRRLQRKLEVRDERIQKLETDVTALKKREGQVRAQFAALRKAKGAGRVRSGSGAAAGASLTAVSRSTRSVALRGKEIRKKQLHPPATARAARRRPKPPAPDANQRHRLHALSSQLASQRKQLRKAQGKLASERRLRARAQDELQRLRKETAVGPFASTQSELRDARKRVDDLQAALGAERRMRGKLEKQYEALRAQVEQAKAAGPSPQAESLRKQLASLKGRQQTLLSGMKRELAGARKRESDLKAKLDAARTRPHGASPEFVRNLAADNAALQARLEEEHRRNRALAAKLKMATRVTDLIFKMETDRRQ